MSREYRALAATAILAVILAGCAAKPEPPVAGAREAVARQGRIEREIAVSGVLAPRRMVNIYPKLSGLVKTVSADVGDRVKAGQLLVAIDAKELEAQLQVAQASLATVRDQAEQAKVGIETARLNLDLAQKSFDRSKALFDDKVATQSQIDDAQGKLDLAKTAFDNAQRQYQTLGVEGLAQAEAQVNLIQVQISNSEIASPISGTVTNRNLNEGELCSPSAPMMTIADASELKLQGELSQDEVLAIREGDSALVLVDGMGGSGYSGKVSQVGPAAAATGQYFPVAISVANDGRLMAGMTAKASLKGPSEEGVLVPVAAIDRGGSHVFVVQGGRVEAREIRLGPRDSSEALVLSGLAAGETVATGAIGGLQDGDPWAAGASE